ncbi:class I adenylate-forming enzyme family protein [Aquicoccus sp. G2-2]|uniref:class I adenylate-forming enzyme family protein n=1 Tax=Aquicoccus sp. G2-2 TaxID=3092120 RepID=UPI002ADF7A76|nr:class I adenylate-forming enzyme family protein [Aquicoccus sp. G2-2]MEA1112168.1 class I adenylate-forming enzyme family protein [Aquicoccus sp. G2-2]
MNTQHDERWPGGIGGALVTETHFDGREMLCFSDRPRTLCEMLARCVRDFPDRPAIVEGRRLTYRDLDDAVSALAAGLAAFGITKGERVGLLLSNRWQYFACVFACAHIGAQAVPMSTRAAQAELEFQLGNCSAAAFIFEADLSHIVPDANAIPNVRHRFSLGGDTPGAHPFEVLLGDFPAIDALPAHEEDVVVILYTSGTTGVPKGALLTHLGIVHSALTFARCCGLSEQDRALVAVPMSHVTGLVGVSLATIAVGGCVVMMRTAFERHSFLKLASTERISFSVLVPTIYTLIAMTPELDDTDLSNWRIGCFGGASMPVATIQRLAQKLPQLALINAYGATETTSPTTIMPHSDWQQNMDSVGKVVPCGQVKVIDENDNEVAPGEPGELLISGPMVVPGYHNRPDANASEFTNGYWRSGDIGSIDANGFVRVFDRRKDMINRGGFKVFCMEVENTVCLHDTVLQCAIVGAPDPVLGERVHAFVVPRAGATIDVAALRAFCTDRLSDYKRPESYTVLPDALPCNNNGKVQKHTLRKMLEQ